MAKTSCEFVHLHTHSSYSLLDGLSKIPDIVRKTVEFGMPAVAITDHGNMHGIPELFRCAKEVGIKPIAGMEAYICEDVNAEEVGRSEKVPYYHITILARNLEGYINMSKLSTASYVAGFRRRPRIDVNLLSRYRRGLTLLTGCVGGWPQQLIVNRMEKRALSVVMQLADIVGKDNVWLEMQDTDVPEQKPVNRTFLRWWKSEKLGCVATADSHYLHKEDSEVHDVLFCAGLHKTLGDTARLKFNPGRYFFGSFEQTKSHALPLGIYRNSVFIADTCGSYSLPTAGGLPDFVLPDGYVSPDDYLFEIAIDGLHRRKLAHKGEYYERLVRELETVKELGYANYFLIVWDFVTWARRSGIFVGWGRGSSAGSLLSYCLGVTAVDPISTGLYFERFLNRGRHEPPDIDVDVADTDRARVLEYILGKYGADNVSHVVTFGNLGPRQSVIDVGRVTGLSEPAIKSILEVMPRDPALKMEDLLKQEGFIDYLKSETSDKFVGYVAGIAGSHRHANMHAAGILLSKAPISSTLPMMTARDRTTLMAQYEYAELEQMGYEKFDILGLKTLTVIDSAARSAGLDIYSIPLDDSKTYAMLSRGDTAGVFQLEGWGYSNLLKKFKPRSFQEIMMINALYRPGPMQGGAGLDAIIRRRFGTEKVTYPHISLEPALRETYGMLVYQEQVMAVARIMAGYSLEEADSLRKAVGKKKEEDLRALKTSFVTGAVRRGYGQALAEKTFKDIEFFSRYGWNKAHAAAYGMVTYATAYLKANRGPHFFAALLNSVIGDADRVDKYVSAAVKAGIRVEKADVNKSDVHYKVEGIIEEPYILCGLASIRGVGEKSAVAILDTRALRGWYATIGDFRERIPKKIINTTVFGHLQDVGAFRSCHEEVEVPF